MNDETLNVDVTLSMSSTKTVKGRMVLPGLAVHRALGTMQNNPLVTITHLLSGLAVVREFHSDYTKKVVELLSTCSWEGIPDLWADRPENLAAVAAAKKYLDDQLVKPRGSQDNKKRSVRQEFRIAKQTGGKVVPGSGAIRGRPRDLASNNFLIEAKTTTSDVYAVEVADLALLMRQATARGKIGAYVVQIDAQEELVVLPEHVTDDLPAPGNARTVTAVKWLRLTRAQARESYKMGADYWRVETPAGKFIVLGYESFLGLSKGYDDVSKREAQERVSNEPTDDGDQEED